MREQTRVYTSALPRINLQFLADMQRKLVDSSPKTQIFCDTESGRVYFSLVSGGYSATPRPVTDLFFYCLIGSIDRCCLHDHASSASVRCIIHLIMLIRSIVADVRCFQRNISPFDRPAHDTGIHSLLDHFRKQCQYVKMHATPALPEDALSCALLSHLLPEYTDGSPGSGSLFLLPSLPDRHRLLRSGSHHPVCQEMHHPRYRP